MKTIVQIVRFEDTGDSCYRMVWPAANLAVQDPSLCVLNVDAQAPQRYEYALNADLLVLFQCSDPDMLPVIAARRLKGKKNLVEYNDNFYAPQSWSPVANQWSSARLWALYELFMQESDGVIVTGQGLKDLFETVTSKPIAILTNMLPASGGELDKLLLNKAPLTFGWAGSLGHMADLLAIKPVIQKILEEVPGSTFHVMGNQAIPEQLGIAPERIRFRNWGSMDEYFKFWEPIEVALIPLLDTPYNRCRSDIKVIEVGSRAVAPVVTQIVPYVSLRDLDLIQTTETFQGLADVTVALLKDPVARKAYTQKLFNFVQAERVNDPRQERLNLYRSFLANDSSDFTWPVKGGYHEVKSSGGAVSESLTRIDEAIKLLKAAKNDEALKLIRDVKSKNPSVVDAWHLEIVLVKKSNPADARALLEEAVKRFPDEIKFRLQRIDFAGNKQGEFRELIRFLAARSEGYRSSVRLEVCRYVSQLIVQEQSLVDDAQELMLLFPFDVGLRFSMARLLEKLGRDKEALAQYESLAKLRKEALLGASDIVNYDFGFLDAWQQSLKARIKGGLT